MRYHMVALSMPVNGIYLVLHKHGKPHLCKWASSDLAATLRVREQIASLYAAGPLSSQFSRPEVDLLYDPALTADQAVSRVMPYFIEATPPPTREVYYFDAKVSDAEVIGPAGEEDLLFITIAKGAKTLSLKPDVLEAVGRLNLDTIEGRSSRRLAELVAWHAEPCLQGVAKVVAVPANRNVKISHDSKGEFVTEVPEVWE